MTERTLETTAVRKLISTAGGRSYSVILPIEYVRKLKWKARQKLTITLYKDRIIIKDWKPKKTKLQ